MQLQPISQMSKHRAGKHKAKAKANKSYSIANQIDIVETIKQLNKANISITAYQSFIELADKILPKDNQISLNTNHDELGSNLQIIIELANVTTDDCLQWHEKLLEQWITCNEFDLNILFDVTDYKLDDDFSDTEYQQVLQHVEQIPLLIKKITDS